MSNNVIELTAGNFEQEVLGAAEPVVVEFWAGWSDPSKAMTPVLESIARDQALGVKVARVNMEGNEALKEDYGVQAAPTMLIFHQGSLQDQIVGRATEQEVRDKLKRFQ